ncbi:MAG TPA: hypothetical protein VFY10_05300 [Dehalococcoidia bacterium]|nr:hypothetical protein [Dehalococcoidia bacterium]
MAVVLVVFMAFTCKSNDQASACPTPVPGSAEDALLQKVRSKAAFTVGFPCFLPLSEKLSDSSVTGVAGRQEADLVWTGPFNMTLRQSQFAPAISPDPTGSSREEIQLFSNISAALLSEDDGTGRTLYDLFWQKGEVYYELQASGPPLQRDTVIQIARSLQ